MNKIKAAWDWLMWTADNHPTGCVTLLAIIAVLLIAVAR